MRDLCRRLLAACMALALTAALLPAAALGEAADGIPAPYTVHVRFKASQTGSYPLLFDERLFLGDPTVYDHGLARMSFGLAASNALVETDAVPTERSAAFMEAIGAEDVRFGQWDVPTSEDTIGTAIAQKKIGGKTLVIVGVRGFGYGDEWLSNLKIGVPGETVTEHLGFAEASAKVADRIEAYLSTEVEGPYIIWMAGYSRGGAVSNRTAARLIDRGVADAGNLFVYTFATPSVTLKEDASDERYGCIFNIMGAFDPVPNVPLGDWGFARYGHDLYLTCPEADSDFAPTRAAADAWSRANLGRSWFTNPFINYSMRKLIEMLYVALPAPEDYVNNLQEDFREVWRQKQDPLELLGYLYKTYSDGETDAYLGVLGGFLMEETWQGVLEWAGLGRMSLMSGRSLSENVVREHYPETYLCLLMSSDETIYDFPSWYWRVSVRDQTTLTIGSVVVARDSDDVTGEGETMVLTASGSADHVWPVVTLSAGSAVALPFDRSYFLMVTGPVGSTHTLVIQRYAVGRAEVETMISDPLTISQEGENWTTVLINATNYDVRRGVLSEDGSVQFISSRANFAGYAEDDSRLRFGAAADLAFISGRAGASIYLTAAVLGVLLLGFVAAIILAMMAARRGQYRRASVVLLVEIGICFALTELCTNFLPARGTLRLVFKGLTTLACFLECVLCTRQDKSRRNGFLLAGFILYLVNDLVITSNFTLGLFSSLLGNVLIAVGFFLYRRPDRRQVILWAALTAAGGAALWFLRGQLAGRGWMMLLYTAGLAAMVAFSFNQGKLLRTGALLFLMSILALLYNEVNGGGNWVSNLISLGLYISAIAVMAAGSKGEVRLNREIRADFRLAALRNRRFVALVVLMALLFTVLQLYLFNVIRTVPFLRSTLKFLISLIPVVLAFMAARRSEGRRVWLVTLALLLLLAGDVLNNARANASFMRGLMPQAAGHLVLAVTYCMTVRPTARRSAAFAVTAVLTAGAVWWLGQTNADVGQHLAAGMVFAVSAEAMLFAALPVTGTPRVGALLLFANDLLTAGRLLLLNSHTGVIPAVTLAFYYTSLVFLAAGCYHAVRRDSMAPDADGAGPDDPDE